MNKKIFENARFCPKGDIEANWNKANGFIPLNKEIIIYKPDENHNAARFKIGDGKTKVQDLPFSGTNIDEIQKLVDEKGQLLIDYVDRSVDAIKASQPDWNQHDENAADYIKNKPFGEKNLFEPITWDGVVGYKEKVDISSFTSDGMYAIKVSDAILTHEDYLGATIKAMTPDGEQTLQIPESGLIPKDEVDSVGACGILGVAATITDVNKFNSALGANLFKLPGTYVTYVLYQPNYFAYVSSLSKSEISKIDEKYLPDSIISKLEGKIVTAIFNVTSENSTIELQALEGMAKIDWGDGTIDSSYQHTYNRIGEYECKIYGVTSIGNDAFAWCRSLTSVVIGDSVTTIGSEAFFGCTSLTSVVIPDSVTSIGSRAFQYCSSLTSVVIGNSVTSIDSWAFSDCTSLTEIQYNATECADFSPSNSTFFNAGQNGEGITIIIGSNVKKIPAYIFYPYSPYHEPKIVSVIFEEGSVCESIGDYAFHNCDLLTSIEIPNSVTSIGEFAFEECSSLTSVVIPDSVTSIGNSAFENCTSLTSVVIPDSVNQIGNNAFQNCWKLANVTCPSSALSHIPKTNLQTVVITSGNTINQNEFFGCDKLTNVVLDDSINTIDIGAFQNCTSLTNVKFGNGLNVIGESAFEDCSSLASIMIPNSVTEIHFRAFYGCTNLSTLYFNAINAGVSGFAFAEAGKNSTDGIRVIFGSSVQKVPDNMMAVPRSESGTPDVYYKPKVTQIVFEQLSICHTIGNNAFDYANEIEAIILPDSILHIGDNAFNSCYGLNSIKLPEKLQTIGNGAFYWTNIKEFISPDSITSIGSRAFQHCDSLTSVVIPKSVTSIGDCAFSNCSSLRSVIIPKSVTSIGADAFYECDNLTIYCETGSQPSGWAANWNSYSRPVHWGYKHKDYPWIVTKLDSASSGGGISGSIGFNRIPLYNGTSLVNSALKDIGHIESEKVLRVKTDSTKEQSITITDNAIYNSKDDALSDFFNLSNGVLQLKNSSYTATYNPWGISFQGKNLNFPTPTIDSDSLVTKSQLDYHVNSVSNYTTNVRNELLPLITKNIDDISSNKDDIKDIKESVSSVKSTAEKAMMERMEGWRIASRWKNYNFETQASEGSLAYKGFSNCTIYVNIDDETKHMAVLDVYVLTKETIKQEAMTIPSILGSSTIGYKWENGYFPIKIALEWDSIVGDGVDWTDFTRRDVVEYSWIRDSDNLESNAGWMDGSGQVSAHITNQKIKDGAGNLTDILSYVQGQAVALSTNCNFELPIDGQHFVIKMYDFFN